VKEVLADGGPLSSLFSSNPRIATGPTAARLQDRFGVVGFLEKYAVEDIPAWGQDITRSINDANLRSGFPRTLRQHPTGQSPSEPEIGESRIDLVVIYAMMWPFTR
jgi:hypothetical protein